MKAIQTRVAMSCNGDNRYFGHGALSELAGNETMTGLFALACTGRRATREERELLDLIACIINSADARIWPLKMTRLVASYGGTLAAFGAAQFALEGTTMGPWIIGYAAQMLLDARAALERCGDREEMGRAALRDFVGEKGRRLYGYGVPLRRTDERMDALQREARVRGFAAKPFWRLQEQLNAVVLERKGLMCNVGIGLAAMLLDMGYSPSECSRIPYFLNQNVFVAHAVEGARLAPAEMRRLPEDAIEYLGPARRESPRAKSARGAGQCHSNVTSDAPSAVASARS